MQKSKKGSKEQQQRKKILVYKERFNLSFLFDKITATVLIKLYSKNYVKNKSCLKTAKLSVVFEYVETFE